MRVEGLEATRFLRHLHRLLHAYASSLDVRLLMIGCSAAFGDGKGTLLGCYLRLLLELAQLLGQSLVSLVMRLLRIRRYLS